MLVDSTRRSLVTSLLRSSIISPLWTNTDLGAGSVGMQMVALGCSEAPEKLEAQVFQPWLLRSNNNGFTLSLTSFFSLLCQIPLSRTKPNLPLLYGGICSECADGLAENKRDVIPDLTALQF